VKIIKRILSITVVIAGMTVGFIYVAPEKALNAFLELDRQRAGLTKKQLDLGNGLHFVYLEGGQGANLILLHGFGADKDNFTRTANFLTPHFHVIIPDLIGFGESSHPSDISYTPEAQAKNLKNFLEELQIHKFNLGGSSMGGHVAISYAALYPNEVLSLWLLDSGGIWSGPDSELSKVIAKTGKNPLMAKNEKEFRTLYKFVMSDPPFVPGPILDTIARNRINNFELESKIYPQLISSSAERLAAGVKQPTLIVWGKEDRAIHVGTADVLHKLIPQSEVVIMSDVGHLPMLERPRRTAEDFLNFQSKISAR
jgi:pimeloyl-ACP methyl ester carboxylesterase